jgi:holo-[acyl-carrier protein] synthase
LTAVPPLRHLVTVPTTVGVDIVTFAEVEEMLAQHGERYIRRTFTPREVEGFSEAMLPRGLAACFAAKEATIKAIPGDHSALDWRSIEIVGSTDSRPAVILSGLPAEAAALAGITQLSISIDTTRTFAAAVAVGRA